MIVSHRHKFIFLKPRKVAGTSFEIALSKFCGPDDIITPLSPRCENIRSQLGFRGPQNYSGKPVVKLLRGLAKATGLAQGLGQPGRLYFNHMTAKMVKNRVGLSIWDSYSKISIIRNPYDVHLSSYFWSDQSHSFDADKFREFFCYGNNTVLSNRRITQLNSVDIVDFWMRFERLEPDCRELETQLPGLKGLSELIQTVRAKQTSQRREGQSLEDLYDQVPEIAYAISILHKRELEQFNYPALGQLTDKHNAVT